MDWWGVFAQTGPPTTDQLAQGLSTGNVLWIILALLAVGGSMVQLIRWLVDKLLAEKDERLKDSKASKEEMRAMLQAHAASIADNGKALGELYELVEEKLGQSPKRLHGKREGA